MADRDYSSRGQGVQKGVNHFVPISEFREEQVEVRDTKRFAWRDIEAWKMLVESCAADVARNVHDSGKGEAGGVDLSSTTNGGVKRPVLVGIDSLL